MKIKHLLFSALAATTFAACSSTDEISEVQKPVWDKDGKGYLSFSIHMPTQKATRANDNFNEGLASEYAVHDVALLLFKGADEKSAVYQSFVNITDTDFGDPSTGTNVTLDKKWVAKIQGMDINPGEKVYALAVINRNKVFDNENNRIGGIDMSGKTFGYLQENGILNTTVNANGAGVDENAGLWSPTGGILMLNAPLCNVQGSTATTPTGAKINILQEVTASIKPTENEAREADCANIYVERAVAKVTVTHDDKTGDVMDGSTKLFSWDLQEWRLDHTNTKSYVVRNMSNFESTYDKKSHAANSVYRMIGSESVRHQGPVSMGDKDTEPRYRTYFAIDPNYDATGTFNAGTSSVSFGSATPQYCAENVFDVAHQIWGQTTRVIVKAILTPGDGDSYYAHPGDNKFLSQATVKEMAYTKAIAKYREHIKKFRDANILTGSITYSAGFASIDPINGVTVTLPTANIEPASGITDADIEAVGVTGVTGAATLRAYLDKAEFQIQLIKGADMGVSHYNGGATYYQVRIKHFGDDLTPWNNSDYPEYDGSEAKQPSAGGIDAAYPSGVHNDCNYLGRYGVLRNNWYEINLTNVVKIGYASPDDLKLDGTGKVEPGTPDDHIEKEQWINAEVNILSWAKRLQNNNLGED